MGKIFETPLGTIIFIISFCIGLFILGIIFTVLPEKKLCEYCEEKKTRQRNKEGKLCCEACQ